MESKNVPHVELSRLAYSESERKARFAAIAAAGKDDYVGFVEVKVTHPSEWEE